MVLCLCVTGVQSRQGSGFVPKRKQNSAPALVQVFAKINARTNLDRSILATSVLKQRHTAPHVPNDTTTPTEIAGSGHRSDNGTVTPRWPRRLSAADDGRVGRALWESTGGARLTDYVTVCGFPFIPGSSR